MGIWASGADGFFGVRGKKHEGKKRMSAKGKYRKLIDNTAIIAAGQIGSKVLVYLLVRFYTSVMTTEQYSVASNLTSTANLLIPIISLEAGEAVFRFVMDKSYREKESLTSGYAVFLLGCLLFAIAVPALWAIPYFAGMQWLIITYVITSVLHAICSQFIRAQGNFKLYALQGIINTSLTIIFNLIFLLPLNMAHIGYVLSVSVADFLTMLFIFFTARLWRYFSIKSVKAATVKSMLKYSIPLIPTSIFWWTTNVSDRYMITYFKGDAVNGLYDAAYKIPTLLMVLSGIFVNAWRNSAIDEKDSKEYKSFLATVFDMFSGVIFIIASGIIAFTPLITFLMFDSSFHDSWRYIPVLTAGMAFFNFASFLGNMYIVAKKTVWSFITSMTGALTNIVLNLLLIPRIGAQGAAIATLISFVVMFAFRIATTRSIAAFKIRYVKLVINGLLLVIQCVIMLYRIPGWIIYEGLCLIVMMLINGLPYLKKLIAFLNSRNKKKSEK